MPLRNKFRRNISRRRALGGSSAPNNEEPEEPGQPREPGQQGEPEEQQILLLPDSPHPTSSQSPFPSPFLQNHSHNISLNGQPGSSGAGGRRRRSCRHKSRRHRSCRHKSRRHKNK